MIAPFCRLPNGRRLFLLGLAGLFGLDLGSGLNGPLLDLDADAVLTGLEGDGILGDLDDLAGDAADGGDLFTKAEGIAHFLGFLFPLILRPDHDEVHEDEHQDQREHQGQHGTAGRGIGIGSCLKKKEHRGYTSDSNVFMMQGKLVYLQSD